MRIPRSLILSLVLGAAALAAMAQTSHSVSELTFTVVSAKVQKFNPPIQARNGRYEVALVLRLDTSVADNELLPPDSEAFLYIGTHELRPIATDYVRDRLIYTFHDPDWQQLKGGEPMVLTTLHGDPIHNPERYKGYPQFDPKIIGQ